MTHRILIAVTVSFSLVLSGCAAESRQIANPKNQKQISSIKKSHSARSKAKKTSSSIASIKPVPPEKISVPILVYHHIRHSNSPKSTWSWKMSVSPDVFGRQLQWMLDHGYTTITLDTLVSILRGEIKGPVKPVVITFDDNQLSQYDLAFPMLKQNHQVAVFYMITDKLDTKGYVTRDKILEMRDGGMDFQSHTLSHRVLTALPSVEVERDLADSKKKLEELLGTPVRHLAYPGTAHNQTVRDIAKRVGYITATIMDPRWMNEKDDWMRLPRIMMTDDTDLQRVLP